jgi:hypothetical protein
MKEDLFKDFISVHQKVGKEETDHTVNGGTNSVLNIVTQAV